MNPAWVVVGACFLVIFGVWNSHAGFGVFLPVLSNEFGWSRGSVSVAASLNQFLGGAIGVAVGAASDRHGPRPVLVLCTLGAGAAFLLTSSVGTLWQYYLLQGLLLGGSMSVIYVVPTATVSRWFADRRGLALGIVLCGQPLAFVTGGPLAASLIGTFGWRRAYLILGALVWLISLPASWKARFPPGPRSHQASRAAQSSGAESTFREALRNRRLWLIGGTWLLQGVPYMMVAIHIVPYVRDRGVSLEHASLALTVYGISNIVGRLLSGVAADRLGTRATFSICSVLAFFSLAGMTAGPWLGLFYALTFGFGLGVAGCDTAAVKAIAEVFGLRAIGAIIGLLSLLWRIGGALGPTTAGFVYDVTGSYVPAFLFALFAMLVSLILFILGLASPHRSR